MLRKVEFLSIQLEELGRLGRVATSHVVERHGGDVVCLTFTYQSVVFEEILKLGFVLVSLGT